MLRDAYGNTYTYGAPREGRAQRARRQGARRAAGAAVAHASPLHDAAARPRADRARQRRLQPAGAGREPPAPTARAPARGAAAAAAPASPRRRRQGAPLRQPGALARAARRRARARSSTRRSRCPPRRACAPTSPATSACERDELELKRLYPGRRVIAGTILGRIGRTDGDRGAPHMLFEIRPPGTDVPRIDPEPFLEGWRLLESTAIYRAQGPGRGGGRLDRPDPAHEQGHAGPPRARRPGDRGLRLRPARHRGRGRRPPRARDARVPLRERPAADGVIAALRARRRTPTSGNVSQHTSGNGVDISKINGTPILGNQGAGSIADATIRRLLTLQGTMAPDADHQPHALPRRREHARAWPTTPTTSTSASARRPAPAAGAACTRSACGPRQWLRLVDRLGPDREPGRADGALALRDPRGAAVSPTLRRPQPAR